MPTVVLDQQIRNGTVPTSSVPVPAGATGMILSATMSDADAGNAANSIRMVAEIDFGDGTAWQPLSSNLFSGGSLDKQGNPTRPSMQAGWASPPRSVRGTVDTLTRTLNFGCTIDFVF